LEESKGIEPLSLTASRFQIGVLVHAGRFPFSQLLELETSLGVEPRTSSFAAKTHAVWIEIIWCPCQDLGFQVLTFDSVTLETFGGKSSRVLVTCAGLEPANRQLERLFARPLRVARRSLMSKSCAAKYFAEHFTVILERMTSASFDCQLEWIAGIEPACTGWKPVA
jgi:hypothetical protein